MSGRWERDWMEIPVSGIRVDDIYANNGSITKVVHGPATATWGGDTYTLEAGYSLIACGEGMAITRIATTARRVIGRNPRRVAS